MVRCIPVVSYSGPRKSSHLSANYAQSTEGRYELFRVGIIAHTFTSESAHVDKMRHCCGDDRARMPHLSPQRGTRCRSMTSCACSCPVSRQWHPAGRGTEGSNFRIFLPRHSCISQCVHHPVGRNSSTSYYLVWRCMHCGRGWRRSNDSLLNSFPCLLHNDSRQASRAGASSRSTTKAARSSIAPGRYSETVL